MNNPLPLISVIVPVYKVEPYIHRCIDSIIHQTYQNLEIILVDDGSPDNCGKICDEYAAIDSRIKVIHQKNGGLSAARNSGIDICKGEYIGFVDSDDCIHPEMYQRLYDDICIHKVKLAFCHPNMCKGEIKTPLLSHPTICHPKDHVLLRSMIENIWWSAWTKLYHRSLFNDIRYPYGKTNEYYAITMFIYDQCDQIAINYNKLYNYCIRENSICTSPLNIKKFDQIENTLDVVHYMKEKHPEWQDAAEYVFLSTILKLLTNIYNDKSQKFNKQKDEIYSLIKTHYSSAMKNKYLLKQQKAMLFMANVHPVLFKWTNHLYNFKQRMKA